MGEKLEKQESLSPLEQLKLKEQELLASEREAAEKSVRDPINKDLAAHLNEIQEQAAEIRAKIFELESEDK